MSITATVENDTIKLPVGALPNGTQVRIELVPTPVEPPKSFSQRYAKFIGSVSTGVGDLAANHDHYLYGTPKRSP